jgi:hypothetical protein
MALRASEANFEARQLKRGGGWYVLASWVGGRTAQVDDFANEAAAEEWIKSKSAAWLKARQTGSHD